LVIEAMRNSESRCTEPRPIPSRPCTSTCTSSPRATSATRPGTVVSPTWRSAASCTRSVLIDLQVDRSHPRLVVAIARHGGQLGLDSPQILVGQLHVRRGGVLLEVLAPLRPGD